MASLRIRWALAALLIAAAFASLLPLAHAGEDVPVPTADAGNESVVVPDNEPGPAESYFNPDDLLTITPYVPERIPRQSYAFYFRENGGRVYASAGTFAPDEGIVDVSSPVVPTLGFHFKNLRGFGLGLGVEPVPVPGLFVQDVDWKEAYAIDPAQMDFDEASFSKVAQGNVLYKCASWKFKERVCPDGWVKFRDLAPGETYTVGLSASDPAFLEGNRIATYNPTGVEFMNLSGNWSGGISDLASDNNVYLSCRSYPSYFNATSFTNGTFVYRSATGTGINIPHIRNWTSLSVQAEQDLPTTGDQMQQVRVLNAPYPGVRPYETAIVTLSRDGNLDSYIWNGSAWITQNNIGSIVATDSGFRSFDLAYETNTSRLMLLYPPNTNNVNRDLAYRIWNGTVWSTEAYIDDTSSGADINGRFVHLAANPWQNSTEMVGVYVDRTNNDVEAFVWNGTTWNNETEITGNVSTATLDTTGVAYETTSGRAVVVSGNGTVAVASNVIWKRWTGSPLPASWSASSTFDPNSASAQITNWITIKSDPQNDSDRMMLTSVDSLSDLATSRYDGSGWNVDAPWDASVDGIATRVADFEWYPNGTSGLLVWGTTTGSLSYRNFTAPSTWQAERTLTSTTGVKTWVILRHNSRNITGDTYIMGVYANATQGALSVFRWNSNETLTTVAGTLTNTRTTTTNESFDFAFSNMAEPLEYTAWLDFNGTSNLEIWNKINWSTQSQFNLGTVNVTWQLYNYTLGDFAPSGTGYSNYNSSSTAGTDETNSTAITTTPNDFRQPDTGVWELRMKAVKVSRQELTCKVDWVEFNVTSISMFGLNTSNPLPLSYITAYSFWTAQANPLSMYSLEWNATGAPVNNSWLLFNPTNNTWGNYSIQIPGAAEGRNVTVRIFANDSANAFNASKNLSFIVQNVTPVVNSTTVNVTSLRPPGRICVTAVSGDYGSGVSQTLATVTYSNGTVMNLSLSDTGCAAAGAGDNLYGGEILTQMLSQNITVNTSYGIDGAGNTGAQHPWPSFNITSINLPPEYNVNSVYLGVNSTPIQTGDQVLFFSHWVDDISLSSFLLEWNESGSFLNESETGFGLSNGSWANFSATIPKTLEGSWLFARIWANDSENQFNHTSNLTVFVSNQPPIVNDTRSDKNATVITSIVCINATAGDSGIGLDQVWAQITFPNGTVANWSLSDTGCNAGDPGDIYFGRSIGVGSVAGNFTINRTYASDLLGNEGFQQVDYNVTVSAALSDAPKYSLASAYFGFNDTYPLPGAQIKLFSFWTDDVGLSNYTLVWNISGNFLAQDYLDFVPDNLSWGNYTLDVDPASEGGVFGGRIRANDSDDQFNATPNLAYAVQNVSPLVNSTALNQSDFVAPGKRLCVSARAGDIGVGVSQVWAMVNYPNGTVINVSLSDTGCDAGGAGDDLWGVEIETGYWAGNLTVNTTYANDTLLNMGWESPFPALNITVNSPPYFRVGAAYLGANVTNADTDDNVTFFSYWYDDLALSSHFLDWNGSGSFVNTTLQAFPVSNATWGNVSVIIPKTAEGLYVFGRMWANDSANTFNVTQNATILIANRSPLVNSTGVDPKISYYGYNVCINASAGDAGIGIQGVWVMVNYPNGTAQNYTLSDTGCNAAGAGDNWYGVLIDSGGTNGNLTVNYTYANDSLRNFALQVDNLNISVSDPFTRYYPSSITFLNDTTNSSGGTGSLSAADSNYLYCNSFPSLFNDTSYTNATFVYRSSIGSGLNVPHFRNYTNKEPAAEQDLPTSGDQIQQVRVAYAPYPGNRSFERTAVTLSRDGNLDAYIWNGTTWVTFNNIGSILATDSGFRSFDIAYATNSSDLMLLYAVNSANTARDLGYKIWNGSSWSAEAYIDDTSSGADINGRWVHLAANPWQNSSEMIGAYVDRTSNDVEAFVWNGTTWNNETEITGNVSTIVMDTVGVAYETKSGRGVVVSGNGTLAVASNVIWKRWTGSPLPASWSASATFDPNSASAQITQWITLKADPASDRMMLVSADSLSDLYTSRYDGSGWAVDAVHDATIDTAATRVADFEWYPAGTEGLLVWGTTTGSMSYRNFTAPNSWQAARTFTTSTGTKSWVTLRHNSRTVVNDTLILGVYANATQGSMSVFAWNQNETISTYRVGTLTNSMSVVTNESFDFGFANTGAPLEYTSQLEFGGTSDNNLWENVTWRTLSAFGTGNVNVTWQLYNYTDGAYSQSGPAYSNYNSSPTPFTDEYNTSTILTTPSDFRFPDTSWVMRMTAVKPTTEFFQCRINLVQVDVNGTFAGNPPYYRLGNAYIGVNDSSVSTGDAVNFFSYWYDDSGLGRYHLEWNASGAFSNQSSVLFDAFNDTWGNATGVIPASAEGQNISGRVWARDTAFQYNVTPMQYVIVGNASPVVNSTSVNVSSTSIKQRICITAVAGDDGIGVSNVWAFVNFPNGTSQNWSMSDTGCGAGGSGDNLYGVEIPVNVTPGIFAVNTTFSTDAVGNIGWQSGWPVATVTVVNGNPMYNGSSVYLGVNATLPKPGQQVLFRSFWWDDSGLEQYWLEWNATGVFANTSPQTFAESNNSWGNVSSVLPAFAENKTIWWRLWANGSDNMTDYGKFGLGGDAPFVANTSVNVTSASRYNLVCVNATVNDSGTVNAVWAMITYPNGTSQNWTMSDTGCLAGIANDGWYGVQINVSGTLGNLTVNTTYANDVASNLGWEDPWPGLNVSVIAPANPIGGSGQYVGFFGTSRLRVSNQAAQPANDLYNSTQKSGSVLVTKTGDFPTWSLLKAADASAVSGMDTRLGLSGFDALANNFVSTGGNLCHIDNVRYLTSSDGNWNIGVLYSDEDNSASFNTGDMIIFCVDVNPNALDFNGSRSDYEIVFPKALAGFVDFWQQE